MGRGDLSDAEWELIGPLPPFERGRWAEQGDWDALLQTLVDLGLTDDWQHMIDSTTVRGHVSAVGGKGGLARRLLVGLAAALRARHPRCYNCPRPRACWQTRVRMATGSEETCSCAASCLIRAQEAANSFDNESRKEGSSTRRASNPALGLMTSAGPARHTCKSDNV